MVKANVVGSTPFERLKFTYASWGIQKPAMVFGEHTANFTTKYKIKSPRLKYYTPKFFASIFEGKKINRTFFKIFFYNPQFFFFS